MRNRLDRDLLLLHLRNLVARILRLELLDPDRIAADEPLMGGRLGLDSLDELELAICVEEEFGIAICGKRKSHHAFASIGHLADFILAGAPKRPANRLWTAKAGGMDRPRAAPMAFAPAGRPLFSSAAILTF